MYKRRCLLRSVPVVAAGGLTVGTASGSSYRYFNLTETEALASEDEGAIDYFVGVNSYDVHAVDTDSEDSVDNDRNHDTTSIWGTVYGDTDRYKMEYDAEITYISGEAKEDFNCTNFNQGCGPKLYYTCDDTGVNPGEWQLRATDNNESNYNNAHYHVTVSESVTADSKLEDNDNASGNEAEGYVGHDDEDNYIADGNFDNIEMYPMADKPIIKRVR
jgi:hypothetical protein